MKDSKNLLNLLRRIEEKANAASAATREVVINVGPFQALLSASTAMTWVNYAVPVAPLGDARAVAVALDDLKAVFAERQRLPRFEFNDMLWPELPGALERAGFYREAEHPMMLCARAEFRPRQVAGVEVRLLMAEDDEETLRDAMTVQRLGFGITDEEDRDTGTLRAYLRGGIRTALARIGEAPAGIASTVGDGDIRELAGVATVPEWRRRGVASSVGSAVIQDHFDRGGALVWLSAGDAVAQAVYTGLGFRCVATRLNYITPDPSPEQRHWS